MSGRRGLVIALLVALGARALPLVFGLEHYGDSPVRIELAERWAQAPHLFRGFTETYQYGPLHLAALGAFGKLLGNRLAGARLLSLAAGLAGIWLLYRLTLRARSPEAALAAAFGLALSPLHIQSSTTGASEAVFLALLLGAVDRVLDDDVLVASLLLGAAGLVRYDGWLYLPLLVVLHLHRHRSLLRSAGLSLLAAAPALWWMWQNHHFTGDALAPIHWIDHDHAALAKLGLEYFGQARYRLYCLVYWPAAMLLVATPALSLLSLAGAGRALLRRTEGWELAALALVPTAYFTFRGAVLADFRPMARFALVAATLALPYAHDGFSRLRESLRRPALAVCAALLFLTPLFLAAASYGRNGSLAEWARPLSPISSVPPGVAQAAQYVKEHAGKDDVVLLDGVWDYLDVPLAFAAGLPDHSWTRLAWTDDFEQRFARREPTMAVLLYQGNLHFQTGADETSERFTFRGLHFCAEARFVYAGVYRRCP